MGIKRGPTLVREGLVLHLDAANPRSYPGSGTTWKDLTSEPINPTLKNGISTTSDLKGGFQFDGTDDWIELGSAFPNTSKISFTGNFTIEQIFKPTGYQPNAYYGLKNLLFVKGNLSTVNYLTQLNSSTQVRFTKRSSPESLQNHDFTVPSMTDKANILTFTINSNTTVSCYMNGTHINTVSIAGLPMEAQATELARISWASAGDMAFIGNYYSCKIYNRALTASEVQRNFNAIRSRFGI
jgi:hypothetical protein